MWGKIVTFFRSSYLWIRNKIRSLTFDRSIALTAIAISFLTLGFTGYQEIKSNHEAISIFPYQPDGDYAIMLLKDKDSEDYILPLQTKFLISNNGDKTVSLVYFASEQYKKINEYPNYTAQTDVGLIDEDQKKLRMPFIIPSGEGKIFIYNNYLKLTLDEVNSLNNIYKKYNQTNIWENSLSYYEFLSYASEGGLNILGSQFQPIDNVLRDEKGYVSSGINIKKDAKPFTSIFFRSSKGNEFRQDLTFMIHP